MKNEKESGVKQEYKWNLINEMQDKQKQEISIQAEA